MNETNCGHGLLAIDKLNDRIDLLAEGELTGDERNELIRDLDSQPELWRRCALAFIERSVLSQTLGQISRQGEPALAGVLGPVVKRPCDAASPKPTIRWNRITDVVGAAVCLLVLVAAGYLFGVVRGRVTSSTVAQVDTSRSSGADGVLVGAPDANHQLWLQACNAVRQLSVADGEVVALVQVATAEAQFEVVPIIHSELLADQVRVLPRPEISPAIVDQVERAGWRLDTSRQFLSFHLPDGENRVLPVDTVNYRFVGHEVF